MKKKAAVSMVRRNNVSIIYWHFVFLVEKKPGRKKRRQENVASCEKCGVSFAKLLKRKVSVLVYLIIVYELNFLTSISVITVGQCAVGRALSRLKNFS